MRTPTKSGSGHVELAVVFSMPKANEFLSAVQVLRDPVGRYLLHMTDFTGRDSQMLGFFSREEMVSLCEALSKDLAQ